MNKLVHSATLVFAVIGAASVAKSLALPAFGQTGPTGEKSPKPVAKVTPVAAMKAAEQKVGGTAKMAIFEFDEGHWIYGVLVAKQGKLMEVDVDPVTGKAGSTETVTAADEVKEFQAMVSKFVK